MADDFRMFVEGQIMNILTNYGGERLVAGPSMEKLLRELTDECLRIYYECDDAYISRNAELGTPENHDSSKLGVPEDDLGNAQHGAQTEAL